MSSLPKCATARPDPNLVLLSMFPRRLHSFLGNTSSPLPQGQQLLDGFSSPMTEPPDFHSLPHQSNPPSLLHHQLAVTCHVGAINGSWNLFQPSRVFFADPRALCCDKGSTILRTISPVSSFVTVSEYRSFLRSIIRSFFII